MNQDNHDFFYGEDAENTFVTFDNKALQIGPRHSQWIKRVKLEMHNISTYLNFLKNSSNSLWFTLAPSRDKQYNFKIWEGKLIVPQRTDIGFDMVLLLTSEYPNVFPRAFIEEDAIKYVGGNLYVENRWKQDGKTFVMICHDHMKDLDIWKPNLSIAHFLLREILVWWNSKINTVIRLYDDI